MNKTYFITSCGTGIGKTLITATLAYQLKDNGQRISALKPVISGYQDEDEAGDVPVLLAAQGLVNNQFNRHAIAPWRFAEPLSPHMAAAKEGKEIIVEELVEFCSMSRTSDITLVEGAGGVMAPLSDTHTIRDWIAAVGCPAILVVGNYLGSISHALTAAEALHAKKIPIQALIVSESEHPAMDIVETASIIKKHLPYVRHVVALPRVAGSQHLWQVAADITWILE